jgi:5'-nucleotidase
VASGYKPLDRAAVYRIASLDFMFGGGDGYTMFKNGQNVRGGDVPQEQVVIDYIKANSPVSPQVEGRITLTR